MQLHKPTLLNSLGKRLASPLSSLICSRLLHNSSRAADAYLNFLLGKGAGAGWDIHQETRAAASHVYRAEPTIFDVGANIGLWSDSFLKIFPQARVYMFEPSPTCQEAIRQRKLTRAELVPCAVGETRGTADLHFSSEMDATASLHERSDSYFADLQYRTISVSVVTVDDVIEEKNIQFVDMLKMDIEGHELHALQGAAKSLKEGKIGAIMFEFGSGNINSRTFFKDFWNFLSGANFSISRITPGGKPVPINAYYEDLEYFRGVTNYLAEYRNHPYAHPR